MTSLIALHASAIASVDHKLLVRQWTARDVFWDARDRMLKTIKQCQRMDFDEWAVLAAIQAAHIALTCPDDVDKVA